MTVKARRPWILAAICALVTSLWLALYLWRAMPGHNDLLLNELRAKNQLIVHGRKLASDTNLIFIGITQPSYADIIAPEDIAAVPIVAELTNSFPWSREVWSYVMEKVLSAGAKVVALDLIFAAPAGGDAKLQELVKRYPDRVVLGANIVGGDTARGLSAGITYPSESVLNYADAAAPWSDGRVGFVNYVADADDVVRKATFQLRGEAGLPPGAVLQSLAARILRQANEGAFLPRDDAPHLFRFSDRPGRGYRPVPLYELFLPTFWTNNFAEGRAFKDKIVLIGPAANIFHDEHRTPFPGPTMLGPEIHLNVIAAARRGEFLGETSRESDVALILAAGVLAWLLTAIVRGPPRRIIAAVGLSIGYWALCQFVFNRANFVLLALSPLLVLNVSTLGGFAYEFVLERIEKNRTRRALERYVSKDVVREVLDNPETYLNTLGGVRKPVTILFSDVRGFTTLTEGADPAQLVLQLNEYFKEMVGIVFAHQGSLDKFIGDAVMALWGSITSQGIERDAQNAVAAALAMRKALARLNINWRQRGMTELSFGIGVNHGDAIVGNLGSEEKMEVSVIGDPVNVASRLEGLTKEYKLDLLLGESMVPLVRDRFVLRTVGSVQVKGKTKAARVFTVAADREAGEQPPTWLARYERGIEQYRGRKFAEGAEDFAQCLREQPGDHLSQVYLDACRELMANPPGLDWDTVVIMKTK
jgi:adenylate cyclase